MGADELAQRVPLNVRLAEVRLSVSGSLNLKDILGGWDPGKPVYLVSPYVGRSVSGYAQHREPCADS